MPEINTGRYCLKCGRTVLTDIATFCPFCKYHVLPTRWESCFTLSMFRSDGSPAEYPKDFNPHNYNPKYREAIAYSTKLARDNYRRNKQQNN